MILGTRASDTSLKQYAILRWERWGRTVGKLLMIFFFLYIKSFFTFNHSFSYCKSFNVNEGKWAVGAALQSSVFIALRPCSSRDLRTGSRYKSRSCWYLLQQLMRIETRSGYPNLATSLPSTSHSLGVWAIGRLYTPLPCVWCMLVKIEKHISTSSGRPAIRFVIYLEFSLFSKEVEWEEVRSPNYWS